MFAGSLLSDGLVTLPLSELSDVLDVSLFFFSSVLEELVLELPSGANNAIFLVFSIEVLDMKSFLNCPKKLNSLTDKLIPIRKIKMIGMNFIFSSCFIPFILIFYLKINSKLCS
ncbi:hypothetical protein AC231_04055 [Clostridium pasteurianum]|nr:hypothetical protein AC231_04055 [Clostridium pasteurianum]